MIRGDISERHVTHHMTSFGTGDQGCYQLLWFQDVPSLHPLRHCLGRRLHFYDCSFRASPHFILGDIVKDTVYLFRTSPHYILWISFQEIVTFGTLFLMPLIIWTSFFRHGAKNDAFPRSPLSTFYFGTSFLCLTLTLGDCFKASPQFALDINLWSKVVCLFACTDETCWTRMLQIGFLVSLESSWGGGVHWLGFMAFGLAVQKFLNIEWFFHWKLN